MSKILIVDDSKFMRNILRNIIEKMGHEIIGEGENGYEAVLKYQELLPDILFLDITMPKMNGIEALKRIKQIYPKSIVIMCSAMGQTSYIKDAINLGAKDFIIKPFNTDRVDEAINKL
ncbi:Chemotaxis protein CheY [compost metagenome]